jgi:putative tryptophan/tyrosine transport system substrate-binding protein
MLRAAILLGCAILAGLWAVPALGAQQPPKVPRLGLLFFPSRPAHAHLAEAFRQGLRELGYIEGQNIAIEYRYAEGRVDRLAGLAAELVALKVDVIVTAGSPPIKAAGQATTTIPIIFAAAGDPVAAGHVASLARPGGNITGLSILGTELSGKRLQLLKESSPRAHRVALLFNPHDLGMRIREAEGHAAGRALGIEIRSLEVREESDLDGAFLAMTKDRPDAFLTVVDAVTLQHRRRIVDFAATNRLPAMYETKTFVESGGLMSYGPSIAENYRRAATYVDKILKGARPADLPVEQPTRFELVVNLKTAKALGLTIPPSILVRADQVIQ